MAVNNYFYSISYSFQLKLANIVFPEKRQWQPLIPICGKYSLTFSNAAAKDGICLTNAIAHYQPEFSFQVHGDSFNPIVNLWHDEHHGASRSGASPAFLKALHSFMEAIKTFLPFENCREINMQFDTDYIFLQGRPRTPAETFKYIFYRLLIINCHGEIFIPDIAYLALFYMRIHHWHERNILDFTEFYNSASV